jgi:hypothetical protein
VIFPRWCRHIASDSISQRKRIDGRIDQNRSKQARTCMLMLIMNDSIKEVIAGAAAGALSKTIMAPLDRIKLMVQLQNSLTETQQHDIMIGRNNQRSMFGTTWVAWKNMYQKEGLWALWRGNTPTILIQAVNAALSFMLMDLYQKASFQTVDRIASSRRRRVVLLALLGATNVRRK